MKELSVAEIKPVSGGCGPGMGEGIAEEAFVALLGFSLAAAFVAGLASVYVCQYVASEST